ncbi:MAG: hypothetical protein KDC95_19210 [Planctomycetes bacterium]|nr:hypothetical protein [Planctomycetota bacterium]
MAEYGDTVEAFKQSAKSLAAGTGTVERGMLMSDEQIGASRQLLCNRADELIFAQSVGATGATHCTSNSADSHAAEHDRFALPAHRNVENCPVVATREIDAIEFGNANRIVVAGDAYDPRAGICERSPHRAHVPEATQPVRVYMTIEIASQDYPSSIERRDHATVGEHAEFFRDDLADQAARLGSSPYSRDWRSDVITNASSPAGR